MHETGDGVRIGSVPHRWCLSALLAVMVAATMDWVGWRTGIDALTRINPSWPAMMPWTSLWLALVAAAVGLQMPGRPTALVRAGGLLAVFVVASATGVLAEYVTGHAFGFDVLWFGDAVRAVQPPPLQGRPSPQTAITVGSLAVAASLVRVDRRFAVPVWIAALIGGTAIPAICLTAYLFQATAVVAISSTTGQAFPTALVSLLLASTIMTVRPDRLPLRWFISRPDRRHLALLCATLSAFPAAVALCRSLLNAVGIGDGVNWTLSTAFGAVAVGTVTLYLSQRVSRLDTVDVERAATEQHYRLLADNAVDIVLHLRDYHIVWASPSVDHTLGEPREQWVGSDLRERIHPDDLDATVEAWCQIAGLESVEHRFQIRSGSGAYRWVHGHVKLCHDGLGASDGIIAALRIADEQVEIERRLERLATIDPVTGLVNRAEAIRLLELAVASEQPVGTHVAILFCDIDRFKLVNDTWGHTTGDTVLAVQSARIVECVRPQDTVGRTGGDEIIVILPGITCLDEATAIAGRITERTSEPIIANGAVLRVTVSIGAALIADGENVTTLIARADAAMYQAKQAPFAPSVATEVSDELIEPTSA